MPDTILPPTAPVATPAEPARTEPRIETSNDQSWAGWAISSFTNKIASADGEIEPTPVNAKGAELEPARSASVPHSAKPSTSAQLELPKQPSRSSAHPLSRSQSDRPVPVVQETLSFEEDGDDVFDAWGAVDDDEDDEDPFTAAVSSPKPTSPDPFTAKAPAVPYDDGGEPDFAGWLAAKNQAKAKNPLPKGLNKPASTTTASTKTKAATTKPKTVAPVKKIETKPKDEAEDDGWGAWD